MNFFILLQLKCYKYDILHMIYYMHKQSKVCKRVEMQLHLLICSLNYNKQNKIKLPRVFCMCIKTAWHCGK